MERIAPILAMTAWLLASCQPEPDMPATRSMGAGPASVASAASAASSASAKSAKAPASATNEDLDAGRAIASRGAPGVAACASCHGANGEGNASNGLPRLAGLGRSYIEHQLNSYADGTRANPVMTPIAGALSAQQRTQVASYFARLVNAAGAVATHADAPALVARGDDKRGIPACVTCHSAKPGGDAAANPSLAGQNAPYLAQTLAAWKDGSRHNDPSGRMPAIAKALTDDEVREIAAYYAGS